MAPRQKPREASTSPQVPQMHSLRVRSLTPGVVTPDVDTPDPIWGTPYIVSDRKTEAGAVHYLRLIVPGIAAGEVRDGADTVIFLSGKRRNSLPPFAQSQDCTYVGWKKDFVLAAWSEEFAQSEYAELLTGATNSDDIRRNALNRLRQEVPDDAESMEEWLDREAQAPSMSHPYARLLGGRAQPQLKPPHASQTGTAPGARRSRFIIPPSQGHTR